MIGSLKGVYLDKETAMRISEMLEEAAPKLDNPGYRELATIYSTRLSDEAARIVDPC